MISGPAPKHVEGVTVYADAASKFTFTNGVLLSFEAHMRILGLAL